MTAEADAFIIANEFGQYLALPEGRRCGAARVVAPLPPEWTELDHAARFGTAEAAERTIRQYALRGARVVTLVEVWWPERQ